jgi:hypothetical protein
LEPEEPEDPGPPPPPPVPPVKATFTIHKDTNFGQHLCIVGGHALLGEWDVAHAVPMDWVEGVKWSCTVDLPQHSLIQYKYVVKTGWDHKVPTGARTAHWAGGPDGLIATGAPHTTIEVQDNWIEGAWPDDNPAVKAVTDAVDAFTKAKPQDEWDTTGNISLLPDWANESVFYQIFPLGYFGAPTVNDGKGPVSPRLAQIRDHYAHFTELGIDAVYFSPLFESGTHGYDTYDYMQIDRRLGDVALFKEIVAELHALNIKVVLDGVFNHTGTGHFAFKDLCEKGPAASEFANWYHVGARGYDFEVGLYTLNPIHP